jgi:hypothetical protein
MNDENQNLIFADTITQVAGTVWFMTKSFGEELGNLINLHYLKQNDLNWHKQLNFKRKSQGETTYKIATDFRFQLREPEYSDSPLREVIPGFGQEWLQEAIILRDNLNHYHHGDFEANIDTLERLLTSMSVLAHYSGLKVLSLISIQLDRINKIRQGWVPETAQPLPQPPEEVLEFIDLAEKKKQRIFSRPPVGSRWFGEEGKRAIILDLHLRDAIDAETGKSIAVEIGAGGKEKIRGWIRYFPQGGLLKVSDDGAVMGYIQGLAYLVGWFGEEPDVDPNEIRGYYLPYDYRFTGKDVEDLKTGQLLSQVAEEDTAGLISTLSDQIKTGSILNVTTYGDLVLDDGTDSKQVKLARVHKGIWFENHLM